MASCETGRTCPHRWFQSPSRGGHLCGAMTPTPWPSSSPVSVPFTRGTPLWLATRAYRPNPIVGFSPLHEGDTSVAESPRDMRLLPLWFQSPSRGGHLCGRDLPRRPPGNCRFQSPSRGGHLCGAVPGNGMPHQIAFQSPSRGGHLCGCSCPSRVSSDPRFQSPSRGGHLCGPLECAARWLFFQFQSPSRGGHLCGLRFCLFEKRTIKFQSPSRGGHLCGSLSTSTSAHL